MSTLATWIVAWKMHMLIYLQMMFSMFLQMTSGLKDIVIEPAKPEDAHALPTLIPLPNLIPLPPPNVIPSEDPL